MKVRLKHGGLELDKVGKGFQFHEGPIKTFGVDLALQFAHLFQFHEGPIKTEKKKQSLNGGTKFQFHEGPIKTLRNQYHAHA